MQQLNDIYFKYQILLFYLFPTFLELQIYSQEQILQIFNDYLTISQEPLQICKIRLDIWIPRPNLPLYTHFLDFYCRLRASFLHFSPQPQLLSKNGLQIWDQPKNAHLAVPNTLILSLSNQLLSYAPSKICKCVLLTL